MYPQCRSVTPDSVAQASVAQDLTVLTIWFKYTEMLFFDDWCVLLCCSTTKRKGLFCKFGT